MTNLTRNVRGVLVGYTASRTMDVATT